MTGPALSAWRIGVALALGAGLGLLNAFLRPLRSRTSVPADLVLGAAAMYAFAWLSFAVCRGDIRLGTTAGLLVGAWAFQITAGTRYHK